MRLAGRSMKIPCGHRGPGIMLHHPRRMLQEGLDFRFDPCLPRTSATTLSKAQIVS
jgi:hypothetical protein